MSQPWPGNPFITFFLRAANGTIADAILHTNDRLFAVGATVPEVMHYYTEFNPIYTDWMGKYGQIDFAEGQQKTATQTIEERLAALTAKVNAWDLAIQVAGFIKGSAGYNTFFPQGHDAFTHGKREDRINALRGLSLGMAEVPALAAKKAEVDAEIIALSTQDTTQTNKKGARTQIGLAIKADNALLAQALQGVLGGLMHCYLAAPDEVPTFFRLDLILKKEQRDFTGSVDASAVRFIVQRTLEADEDIDLSNQGDTALVFYFAANITAEPGDEHFQQVDAGANMTVLAGALGASATNKYLLVKNKGDHEGHWRAVI